MLPLEDLLSLAKARGLTVTDYLMAVYLHALYTADPCAQNSRKPLKISIPISLRKFYPSESLRNFSLYANLGLAPRGGERPTFDAIVEAMRGKLAAAATREEMHKLLCQNVALMENPFMRALPNALKRPLMRLGYVLIGEKTHTATLSNMGRFVLPPCLARHVEAVEVLLGESPHKRLSLAAVSDERLLHLYFSGNTPKTDVQRAFLRHLAAEGLRIRAESNIR